MVALRFFLEWIYRRLDLIALVLILVVLAVLSLLPLRLLVTCFVIDDALYYPKIAANISSGLGTTYDGFTRTNGAHPLWQILWVPLAALANQNTDLLLRFGFVLSAAVTGGAFFLVFLLLRRLSIHPFGIAISMMAMFIVRVDLWMSLMESALTFLLLTAVLYFAIRQLQDGNLRLISSVIYGALVAGLFLARLDTVILAPVLMLTTAYVWTVSWKLAARHFFVSSVTVLVIVTPYVIWNLVSFGHLVPVSGSAKMSEWSFSRIDDGLLVLPRSALAKLPGSESTWQFIFVAGFVIVLAGVIYRRESWIRFVRGHQDLSILIGAYVVAVSLRQLYLVTVLADEIVPWYLVPEMVLIMFGIALGFNALKPNIRDGMLVHGIMIVGILAFSVAGTAYLVNDASNARTANSVTFETALWAKENLPEGSRLAMYDSGYVSYISGKDTLSVNGLATDFVTMEALSSGGALEVFEQFDIDYLVQIMPASVLGSLPGESVLFQSNAFPAGHTYSGQLIFVMDLDQPGTVQALLELGYP